MRILIFQVCLCVYCLYLFLTCQKKIDLVPIAINCQVCQVFETNMFMYVITTDIETSTLTGRKEEMHSAVGVL